MNPEDVKKVISTLPFHRKAENVSINEAYQRTLAENIHAKINLPPFKRASMDGYAVKAKDTFSASEDKPISLKLLEVIMAGETPKYELKDGTCIEVSTGAPIPKGADAVIMIEFTEKESGNVLALESVTIGANIANEGSEVKKGELLLSKGEYITPDKIGVLSAIGLSKIPVYCQPKVAIISTGNEIIKLDEKLEYGKIYDVNSYMISNAVKSCGCQPIYSDIVEDDYESLKTKICEFRNVDIIITSGGTSAGAGDILSLVLDEIGQVLVHGIAVKPGKPTIIGLINHGEINKIIFGLPGYPVSALMIFNIFVAPFLKKISALNNENNGVITKKLKLSRRFRPSKGRLQYVLVKIQKNKIYPILKDSGAITAFAEADGYFEIPKNVEILEEGSVLDVTLF